jgi:hypothetical protein
MPFQADLERTLTRRAFLTRSTTGLGAVALATLLNPRLLGATDAAPKTPGALKTLHFAPKAKRVIYLFQSGAPSHLDLFDPKTKLTEMTGQELPPSVRMGQRITGMTAGQSVLKCVGPAFEFKRYGKSGVEMSSLIPNIGSIADDIALVRSMHTDPINHDPAVTFFGTGNQQPGRPTMGAWLAYGLGSRELRTCPPSLCSSAAAAVRPCRPAIGAMASCPANFQGVQMPQSGRSGAVRLQSARIERHRTAAVARRDAGAEQTPAWRTGRSRYRHAHRQLRARLPHADERAGAHGPVAGAQGGARPLYRAEPGKASFANNCLLARRLAERGVRFIQLCHRDWDHHGGLPDGLKAQTKNTDQASAALVKDLKQRGLLDETLVIWGGEFGRTAYSQGDITQGQFRPRPPSALLLDLDGRRRREARPGAREDRRLRLQHRRESGERT